MKWLITSFALALALAFTGCRVDIEHRRPHRPPHHRHYRHHGHHGRHAPNVTTAVEVEWQWHRLGECKLDFTSGEFKTILVDKPTDKFNRISLSVADASLDMYDVTIKLDGGEHFFVGEHHVFASGSPTWVIELGPIPRNVEEITFSYKDLKVGEKATVEAFGQ